MFSDIVDTFDDFVPIVMAVRAPLAIVVRSEFPYRTLGETGRKNGLEIE